ncbi:MAG: type II toxin-antitoxin system Phd/YefM family antitoxin [Spirochaetales bacterium]|nr:type II toxin-antitoxin system Phd/YefM family antitoxin [Spirochaetales bacterium]
MKTLTVGDFKTHFSEVINNIKTGEEYTIEYGRKHEKVAVLIPYSKYKNRNPIKFGILKNKGSVKFSKDFKISTEDFLGLE